MKTPNNCDAFQRAQKKCDDVSLACTRCACRKIPSTGLRRQPPESPSKGREFIAMSPPQTRRSSASPVNSRQMILRDPSEALVRRFHAALKFDDAGFDLSGLAGWLALIPERLGADDLLDKAAFAFLDAFDRLQRDEQTPAASPPYEAAMKVLQSALHHNDQIKSPHPLAAVFMLIMAQKWTLNSANHHMNHMTCTCQLLNDAAEEYWTDSFAKLVRLSAIQIVMWQCVESIINPALSLDSRCLQSLKYEPGPYLALDEENGQLIDSLDLPFLLRLSHLLHAPAEHFEEIRKSYVRLKTEWPFTRRRYQYLSGISKIAGINRSGLVQPEAQLGIAHTITLGISLVLNACLTAMDPTNTSLEQDALELGREAVEVSRKLLQELPKSVWFTPVALFASWIATDDPDVTCSFFSTINECNSYWADPAYIKLAKTFKKKNLLLRVKIATDQKSGGFRNFGLGYDYDSSSQNQDAFPLLSPGPQNQTFGMGSRAGAFSGQLSPSDMRQWDSSIECKFITQ